MKAIVLQGFTAVLLVLSAASPVAAQAPTVTSETFEADVVEGSKQQPIFVNFYAVWCGPCRPLFPVLEAVAADYEGRATLVSVNIDESPEVATAIAAEVKESDGGTLPIPTLAVYRDGQLAETVTGKQQIESKARALFDRHVNGSGGE
jgi:thioredoxin-like negative regulator of GroEL